MHGQDASLGLLAETIRAGLEETARIERKACRKSVARQLRELNEMEPSSFTRSRAGWIAAKCRRCRGCSLAPP